MIHGKPPTLEQLRARLGVDLGGDPAAVQSIPIGSIGSSNVSLPVALDRCRAAEAQLDAARETARAAARRAGKGIGGLFAESRYVLRDSAIRWCDEARSEGFVDGGERMATAFERSFRSEAEKAADPFYNIARTMVGEGRVPGAARSRMGLEPLPFRPDPAPPSPTAAELVQARILKDREVDLSSNAAIGAPTDPAELAAAIHAAAKRAKSPTDADPPRETNALSAAIVAAGKKRRQEDE